jgi:hypothetical protein
MFVIDAPPPALLEQRLRALPSYSALDVAATLAELAGREVVARELPRSEWVSTLRNGI